MNTPIDIVISSKLVRIISNNTGLSFDDSVILYRDSVIFSHILKEEYGDKYEENLSIITERTKDFQKQNIKKMKIEVLMKTMRDLIDCGITPFDAVRATKVFEKKFKELTK